MEVAVAAARERIGFPDQTAAGGIERVQIAVQRCDVYPALPHGDAAIHHVAARVTAPLRVDSRIVFP
jgi:hypothetical protein